MNSKISDKDLSTAQSNFPISPDTTFYALFTHVAVDVCTGQDSLGTAKISKVCNDINDEVTLTATPKMQSILNLIIGSKRKQVKKSTLIL